MNPASLEPRQRRFLAVGLLVAVMLAILLLVVEPFLGVVTYYTGAIEDARFKLDRYKTVAARLPALRKEVKTLEKRVKKSGFFLGPRRPGLAAAELQQRLEAVAEKHGAEIESVQVRSPVEGEMNTRIRLRTTLRADSPTLAKIYDDLETGRPVTFVDEVTINPVQARRLRGPRAGLLEVRFELSGYVPGGKA